MPINSPATGLSQSVPGYLSKFFVALVNTGTGGEALNIIPHSGNAGSGYVVGDVVTVTQGGASGGQATVMGISSTGAVEELAWKAFGTGYTAATGLSTTGGTGTGLEVDILAEPTEFGEMDEFDYTKTRDVLDASSKQSGGWKTGKPGLASWTATAKGLHLAYDVSQFQMRNAISGSALLYFTLYPEGVGSGLSVLTGAGFIKDVKFTSPVKDLSKAEFSIEGSGPLTEATQ